MSVYLQFSHKPRSRTTSPEEGGPELDSITRMRIGGGDVDSGSGGAAAIPSVLGDTNSGLAAVPAPLFDEPQLVMTEWESKYTGSVQIMRVIPSANPPFEQTPTEYFPARRRLFGFLSRAVMQLSRWRNGSCRCCCEYHNKHASTSNSFLFFKFTQLLPQTTVSSPKYHWRRSSVDYCPSPLDSSTFRDAIQKEGMQLSASNMLHRRVLAALHPHQGRYCLTMALYH